MAKMDGGAILGVMKAIAPVTDMVPLTGTITVTNCEHTQMTRITPKRDSVFGMDLKLYVEVDELKAMGPKAGKVYNVSMTKKEGIRNPFIRFSNPDEGCFDVVAFELRLEPKCPKLKYLTEFQFTNPSNVRTLTKRYTSKSSFDDIEVTNDEYNLYIVEETSSSSKFRHIIAHSDYPQCRSDTSYFSPRLIKSAFASATGLTTVLLDTDYPLTVKWEDDWHEYETMVAPTRVDSYE